MAELALLVLTAFWGTTFTLVKWALEISSTSVFLAVRFATAALLLGLVALVRRRPVGQGFWRHGLLLGLFMLTGFVLQTLGLHLTTPARSGFITGMSVLVVPLVARLVLGRHVRRSAWGGAALAVVGLALLTRPLDAGAVTAEVREGDLLTAGSAAAFALQIVFMSEWSPKHPLVPFTLLQISVVLAGALLMLPVEGVRFDASRLGEYAGIVAFTGVVMTALAFFVMNWAQRHTTAVRAALIYALEPVAAALFSWLVIDEQLGASGWGGGGLIVLGVVAGELGGVLEARGEASRAGATAAPVAPPLP
jgi:drug/metabolite transporter (DMT)-like permease